MGGMKHKATKGFFFGALADFWSPLRKERTNKRAGGKRSPLVERLESRELLSISPDDPQAAFVASAASVIIGPVMPALATVDASTATSTALVAAAAAPAKSVGGGSGGHGGSVSTSATDGTAPGTSTSELSTSGTGYSFEPMYGSGSGSGSSSGSGSGSGSGGGNPSLTVAGGSATEGGTIEFTISYSNMPAGTNIGYATQAGSALANYDYSSVSSSQPVSGTGSFNVGVSTIDDGGSGEGSQSFTLTANGDSVTASGTGTIIEDSDPPPTPTISVSSGSAAEGSPISFAINYANMPNGTTISYSTASGSASAGQDFASVSGSFPASGDGEQIITVSTFDDNSAGEGGQTFTFSASGDGASGSGTGTISEDDDGPVINIGVALLEMITRWRREIDGVMASS